MASRTNDTATVKQGLGPEADEDEENDSEPKRERSLADKVEDTIRAFLNFVRSYAHTLRFALSPVRLESYSTDTHNNDRLLIRPLTFLCCSFLPAAVILDLVSDTIWDFLLSPETAASRIAERLQSVSPLKIVLGSIPALIAVYLGSSVLSRIAVRDSEKRSIFMSGICYAFGVQFFSTGLLMLLVLIGHTRVSDRLLPPDLLNIIPSFLLAGLFYLILLGAAIYPFVVLIRSMRKFHPKGRRLGRALLTCIGVGGIATCTYWLGVLPSRFRAATVHEEKITVELIEDRLQITGTPLAIKLRLLITNPTSKLLLVPVDSGLTVRLRLSSDNKLIPRNSFSMHLNVQNAPFLAVHANEANWTEGLVYPDYEDWQLMENNQGKGGSVAVEPTVSDVDGNRVHGPWRDVSFEGEFPALAAPAKTSKATRDTK